MRLHTLKFAAAVLIFAATTVAVAHSSQANTDSAVKAAAALLGAPTDVAVWRHELMPTFRTLEPVESAAMAMVGEGRTFGEICAALVDEVRPDEGSTIAGGGSRAMAAGRVDRRNSGLIPHL